MDDQFDFNVQYDLIFFLNLNVHLDIYLHLFFDFNVVVYLYLYLHLNFDIFLNVVFDFLDDNDALVMQWDKQFWDDTWSRPYGRYNKHHRAIWETMLPYLSGKVVDLGCGACVMYEGQHVDLTGVDFSSTALENAKRHYPFGGHFVCADVSKPPLPLPASWFDTCISIGLLDYFDTWDDVIAEMKRITKPNGTIIAALLHGFEGKNWKDNPPYPVLNTVGNWVIMKIQ